MAMFFFKQVYLEMRRNRQQPCSGREALGVQAEWFEEQRLLEVDEEGSEKLITEEEALEWPLGAWLYEGCVGVARKPFL